MIDLGSDRGEINMTAAPLLLIRVVDVLFRDADLAWVKVMTYLGSLSEKNRNDIDSRPLPVIRAVRRCFISRR
ncbi:hypothetical protein RRG08_007987 [Elysia crispata]|uniref:Uncharacterized protein n=1 Tax=Elysia crispata TaxID=231223 RepID=A0AAE0ZHM9_9GAST|nr:hypothetical protein RRG08_007987 [Elysia crispata]